jgi:hypothetical protein
MVRDAEVVVATDKKVSLSKTGCAKPLELLSIMIALRLVLDSTRGKGLRFP